MHDAWRELRFANADRRKAKAQLRKLKKKLAKDAETYEDKLSAREL